MKKWTEEQQQVLMQAENTLTAAQIAEQLGKTKYDVSRMAKQLNITLVKKVRQKGGDVMFNGSPCLMFMTLEQICMVNTKTLRAIRTE
jgi:hypothetical protein